MGRKPRQKTIPEELRESPESVQALAVTMHAINVSIPEYDWLRLAELGAIRGCTASDIVRTAIRQEIELDANYELISNEAAISLQHKVDKQKRRSSH